MNVNKIKSDSLNKGQTQPNDQDIDDRKKQSAAEISRRSFLGKSLVVGAAAAMGGRSLLAQQVASAPAKSGGLTAGDAALLRFAAAAEILEADFWIQYNELGGIQDSEEPAGSGNPKYTKALSQLDSDMAQYIHDNTDDEFTHFTFLNAYLTSQGAQPVSLEQFRTLPGSRATGSSGQLRLTNLTQLLTLELRAGHSLSQRHEKSGSESELCFRTGYPGFIDRPAHRNPKDERRCEGPEFSPGDREYGRIPFRHHRAGRQQPLPVDGAEGDQRGGVAHSDQYRADGDDALPNLVG